MVYVQLLRVEYAVLCGAKGRQLLALYQLLWFRHLSGMLTQRFGVPSASICYQIFEVRQMAIWGRRTRPVDLWS